MFFVILSPHFHLYGFVLCLFILSYVVQYVMNILYQKCFNFWFILFLSPSTLGRRAGCSGLVAGQLLPPEDRHGQGRLNGPVGPPAHRRRLLVVLRGGPLPPFGTSTFDDHRQSSDRPFQEQPPDHDGVVRRRHEPHGPLRVQHVRRLVQNLLVFVFISLIFSLYFCFNFLFLLGKLMKISFLILSFPKYQLQFSFYMF